MKNCSKNGVKRDGESCSLNNNCIYPKCMKTFAKQWAEEYLNSEEGKAETEKWNKEAISYMLLGKSTTCLNEELLDDISSFIKVEELSVEQIVERFGNLLTEKDIDNIKKMRKI